jgi:hypothetical protein
MPLLRVPVQLFVALGDHLEGRRGRFCARDPPTSVVHSRLARRDPPSRGDRMILEHLPPHTSVEPSAPGVGH